MHIAKPAMFGCVCPNALGAKRASGSGMRGLLKLWAGNGAGAVLDVKAASSRSMRAHFSRGTRRLGVRIVLVLS